MILKQYKAIKYGWSRELVDFIEDHLPHQFICEINLISAGSVCSQHCYHKVSASTDLPAVRNTTDQPAVWLLYADLGPSSDVKPTDVAGSWEGPSALGREEENGQRDLLIQLGLCRRLKLGGTSDQWVREDRCMSANIPLLLLQRAMKAATPKPLSLPPISYSEHWDFLNTLLFIKRGICA